MLTPALPGFDDPDFTDPDQAPQCAARFDNGSVTKTRYLNSVALYGTRMQGDLTLGATCRKFLPGENTVILPAQPSALLALRFRTEVPDGHDRRGVFAFGQATTRSSPVLAYYSLQNLGGIPNAGSAASFGKSIKKKKNLVFDNLAKRGTR